MKKISEGNKGIQALAKKNPSLVEDKFGYDVPGFMNGGMPLYYQDGGLAGYMDGGDVSYMQSGGMLGNSAMNFSNLKNPLDTMPDEYTNNVMDPNFKFEPDLSVDYQKNPYDAEKSTYENYIENTNAAEDEAREDVLGFNLDLETEVEDAKQQAKKDKTDRILGGLASLGSMMSDAPQMTQGRLIQGMGASRVQGFAMGGMSGLQGDERGTVDREEMYDADIFNQSGPGIGGFDINDYIINILGGSVGTGGYTPPTPPTEEELAEQRARRISQGYGGGGGMGMGGSGYSDTTPGQSVSVDAKDKTPESYKFYPSEVSKLYAQMKGVPFSPLVAPPKEATYIDSMKPRRIKSQLYAADGAFVDRSELITGPGGERGDKIPAMLSDGEFVVNAEAVRGMGVRAGANPQDEYEQRLEGARQMYALQKEGEQMMRKYS